MKRSRKISAVWRTPLWELTEHEEGGGFIAVFDLPRGARPLTVQLKDGEPQVWWVVDPSYPSAQRILRVIATGSAYDPDTVGNYIGTFQRANLAFGTLVFHVFDKAGAEALL